MKNAFNIIVEKKDKVVHFSIPKFLKLIAQKIMWIKQVRFLDLLYLHVSTVLRKNAKNIKLHFNSASAKQLIDNTMQEFVTESEELVMPGISEYLRSHSGKLFLENTASENISFISLDSPDDPELVKAENVCTYIINFSLLMSVIE